MRSRFIYGKWPLVSIDPTVETKQTNLQVIRFEGGIENTQLGADFLDADYRLKKICMGLLPSGIQNFNTYWDLNLKGLIRTEKITARFWFYPVLPSVTIREGIVAIQGLTVGVFTEVLSAEINGNKVTDPFTFQHEEGQRFAKSVSDRFEELAQIHPSFSRLQGLLELVAIVRAIEEMDEKPDLTFWLRDYKVKEIKTRESLEVLTREKYFENSSMKLAGGVQLMAIALRLKSGDVSALKEAVLMTRPNPDALTWTFVVGEWIIPTSEYAVTSETIIPLFIQANFLAEQKRYDEAIALYNKLIEFSADFGQVYYCRGFVRQQLDDRDGAISDYNKALELNPYDAYAYNNRGMIRNDLEDWEKAISDLNKALQLNPYMAKAYNNRGISRCGLGDRDGAFSDYNKAIELNPQMAEAYHNRANLDLDLNKIKEILQAIEPNPHMAEAYCNRASLQSDLKKLQQVLHDVNEALRLNPNYTEAYVLRAWARGILGDPEGATADLTEALRLNPRNQLDDIYKYRAIWRIDLGDIDGALADLSECLRINPNDVASNVIWLKLLAQSSEVLEALQKRDFAWQQEWIRRGRPGAGQVHRCEMCGKFVKVPANATGDPESKSIYRCESCGAKYCRECLIRFAPNNLCGGKCCPKCFESGKIASFDPFWGG